MTQNPKKPSGGAKKCLLSRREFLLSSGSATAMVMVTMNSGGVEASVPAQIATYPRKKSCQS